MRANLQYQSATAGGNNSTKPTQPEADTKGGNCTHRMLKWFVTIAVVIALWCGGWFALATWLDAQVVDFIARQQEKGLSLDCAGRDVTGFPFHLGVGCSMLTVSQDGTDARISTGPVNGSAALYRPDRITLDAAAPLAFTTDAGPANARWASMQATGDIAFGSGLDSLSWHAQDLKAEWQNSSIQADEARLYGRPRPVDDGSPEGAPADLDMAAELRELTVEAAGGSISPVDFSADLTLLDGYSDLVLQGIPLRDLLSDGAGLTIHNLAIAPRGGGTLAVQGSLDLTETGLLSGRLRLGVADGEALVRWAKSVDPQLAQPIRMLAQSVDGMGQEVRFGDRPLKSIELGLDRGELRLGFFKLADIPPLRFKNATVSD